MRQYMTKEADFPLEKGKDREGASYPRGRRGGLLLERTKTIRTGDYLEVEIFPVVEMLPGIREKRHAPTRDAQRKVNLRNKQKRLWRLCNMNFGPRDLIVNLTTEEWMTEENMLSRVRKFTRAMRKMAKAQGMPCKYVYVIEITGEGDRRRFHVHMVMNRGFCTFEEMEKIWTHGSTTLKSVRKYPGGLKGWALYVTKNKKTQERLLSRGWASSKGLTQPPPATVSDHKFSRAQADRLARAAFADGRALFEKKYPGYALIEEAQVRYSDWLPGCYIYAMMERRSSVATT